MDKKELYRQVYGEFRNLCAQGKQPCSFFVFCQKRGVSYQRMRDVLKGEYHGVRGIKGYYRQRATTSESQYMQLYDDFRGFCSKDGQPGSFARYCESHGFDRWSVYNFLSRRGLRITELPGYVNPAKLRNRCQEVPFEDVIFEEAGFLPADGGNMITVRVDGHVTVSFPADTDVAVVANFIRSMGKEADNVGA